MHCARRLVVVVLLVTLLSATAGAVLAAGEPAGYTWSVEEVDPSAGYGTSLALDSAGWPHIASGGGGARYAYRDAGGWHTELVDAGDYGEVALALADDGTPHLSYRARELAPETGLKYATYNGVDWTIEEVDMMPSWWASWIGYGSSIALGPDGYPRIAYLNEDAGTSWTLRYATKDAIGWHPMTLYVFDGLGKGPTSLALDSAGYAHIVTFRSAPLADMVHVYEDSAGWHLDSVDDGGQYSGMKLDSEGYPHIAYHHNANQELRYAYKDGQGWHVEVVDSFGTTGYQPSLWLEDGEPRIAYKHITTPGNDLRFAHPEGAGWVSTLVDDGASVNGSHGNTPSLVMGPDGEAHISYCHRDGYNEDLWYARGEFEPEPCTVSLSLAKFDDRDADGARNGGEPLIPWNFSLTVNGVTEGVQSREGDWYTTTLDEDDVWSVSEEARPLWQPTTASSLSGTAGCVDIQALFGNTYIGVDLYLPLLTTG